MGLKCWRLTLWVKVRFEVCYVHLSDFSYYAAILLFPVLSFFIPEPIAARWGARHKSVQVPPDVRAQSEKIGRYLWIVKYLFLLFSVIWLALHFSLISQTFGLHSSKILLSVTWGILGGIFLSLFRAGYRTWHHLITHSDHAQADLKTALKLHGDLTIRPATGTAYSDPRDNSINIDPNFHPVTTTTAGPQPAPTEAILGHELGHRAGGHDDGPGRMNNVNQHENPVRHDLGLPDRTDY